MNSSKSKIFYSKVSIIIFFFNKIALSSSIVIYLLIFATFTMHLALKPKRRVLKVSFSFKIDGEQVIIKVVKEFPPNDS